MRDIRCRVWDKVSKRMSPAFGLFGEFTLLGGVHAWQEHYRDIPKDGCLEALNDLVVLQYTGLKDANGVEIYEGDIIKVTSNISTDTFLIENHSGNTCYCSKPECPLGAVFPTMLCMTKEVIGNIYENPELME